MGRRAAALVVDRGLQTASGGGQLCSKPSELRPFRMRNSLESNGPMVASCSNSTAKLSNSSRYAACEGRTGSQPASSAAMCSCRCCVLSLHLPHEASMWMKCSCSKHAMFFRSPWSPAALPALASPERDSFCDRRKRAFEEPPDGAGSSPPNAGGGKAARTPARRKPPDALKTGVCAERPTARFKRQSSKSLFERRGSRWRAGIWCPRAARRRRAAGTQLTYPSSRQPKLAAVRRQGVGAWRTRTALG